MHDGKIRQVINDDGLQIPLPLIEHYSLQPGVRVILELDQQGIRIVPALPDDHDIENVALRYLLINLGDATQVQNEYAIICQNIKQRHCLGENHGNYSNQR
ncbi:MAG: hypothetical protein GY796_27065 [Chloroflexi bacterium]|nr:hypothetical protein [Chloroflexota bacterium]